MDCWASRLTVSEHTRSFKAWFDQEENKDYAWRCGRSAAEVKYVDFLTEVVFGMTHDAALKLALKSQKAPAEICTCYGGHGRDAPVCCGPNAPAPFPAG